MKIKVIDADYEKVMSNPESLRIKPRRPSRFFRWVMKTASKGDLKKTNFTYRQYDMEKLGKNEPCLILMNHSAFIDLEIAATIMYPRPMNIVCTSDGFVGKKWLMNQVGCIPTRKFISDFQLVKDILYCAKTLNDSILMYPEASYSFDGTATPLPQVLGKLIKKLEIPVVMIRTYGAFHRDPLYNGLRLRNVDVSADVSYILSPSDCKAKTVDEINDLLTEHFTFDHFQWQMDNKIRVAEPFRAEGLNRVLYKCPCCGSETSMTSSGISVKCTSCGAQWSLSEFGSLDRTAGPEAKLDEPDTVPKWYAWERSCVKEEIINGTYRLDIPVRISILRDTKHIYNVGSGRLVHTDKGFHLTGCDGKLDFSTKPKESYSLYSDYFWYEIGDVICIGNSQVLYYCFPTEEKDVVAKTRLAAEELFKLSRQ